MECPFVIQFHASPRGDHFDLMIAQGKTLATFELPCPPAKLARGEPLLIRRLADHRMDYLTYEGEISGGRGSCRIVDRGLAVGEFEGPRWQFELRGQGESSSFSLESLADGQWRLVKLKESTTEDTEEEESNGQRKSAD
jgi:hypothetical protein